MGTILNADHKAVNNSYGSFTVILEWVEIDPIFKIIEFRCYDENNQGQRIVNN